MFAPLTMETKNADWSILVEKANKLACQSAPNKY